MYSNILIKDLFSDTIEHIPTRNGYGEALVDAGKKNKDVVVLCCDLTESTRSMGFKKTFPKRFFEMGIAEQNMIGVAAGLALEGKVPFCSSYAVFNPGRNWDQIRISVCYNNANVKIAGAHAGISVGPDGATHQALEDIAALRAIPNIKIIAPCDYHQTYLATIAAAKIKGPVYIRFARNETPVFTKRNVTFNIGKAQVLKQGADVSLIASGPLVYEALVAAEKLKAQKINAEVINCHTIKPLDEHIILTSLKKTKCAVTIEEHQINGGMGSAIAELTSSQLPIPIQFIGMPNKFGESGQPQELLAKYGMTAQHIISAAKKVTKA